MYSTQYMKMHILVQLFHILKSHTHLHSTGYKNTYLLTQTYKCQKMSFSMAKNYFNAPVKVTFENDI